MLLFLNYTTCAVSKSPAALNESTDPIYTEFVYTPLIPTSNIFFSRQSQCYHILTGFGDIF